MTLFLLVTFFITLFFLLGTFLLTALTSAFRKFHKSDLQKNILLSGRWFFYRPFHLYFFRKAGYEGLFFAALCAQNIMRCCYVASAVVLILNTTFFTYLLSDINGYHILLIVLTCLVFLLLSFIFGDYLPRMFGIRYPEKTMTVFIPFASLFMYVVFPITYLVMKMFRSFSGLIYLDQLDEPELQAKQEIIDIIHGAQLTPGINPHDKKIFESVLSFRERIAREVMVPRVDLFSLPALMSIKEATKLIVKEGYSRIPIYRNTIDEIVGIVMYKDILKKFQEFQENNEAAVLEAPLESLQKNVLFTPETKKISNLLQEFRKNQVHIAIVVDEYGGTEGIVTIEDIFEEIFGNIGDEYDTNEELHKKQPDGSWIVDARMSILDANELLEINIPQEDDYETIGGYVFQSAGTIPAKGFTIHRDDFDLEVIKSNERVVEEVRIKPVDRHIKNDQASAKSEI